MPKLILLSLALFACAKTVPAPGGLGEPCVANGDCAAGFLCAAGRCVLPANLGGCEPGRLRCNGADVEKCGANGLGWDLVGSCATGCSAGADVFLYTLNGSAHAWPAMIGGTPSVDLIWSFFTERTP